MVFILIFESAFAWRNWRKCGKQLSA